MERREDLHSICSRLESKLENLSLRLNAQDTETSTLNKKIDDQLADMHYSQNMINRQIDDQLEELWQTQQRLVDKMHEFIEKHNKTEREQGKLKGRQDKLERELLLDHHVKNLKLNDPDSSEGELEDDPIGRATSVIHRHH